MTLIDQIKSMVNCQSSDNNKLQHMMYVYEGYRSFILDDHDNPYSPGSARAISWDIGYAQANNDTKMYQI